FLAFTSASTPLPNVLPSSTEAQPNDEAGDSDVIEGDEKLKLLTMIERVKHTAIWLQQDMEDRAIIGVFAPCMPTPRMLTHFDDEILDCVVTPHSFKDPTIDDAAVMKAVRCALNGDKEEASRCIGSLDRKLRIVLETLLESLPLKEDRSVSESTFVANYISPILRGLLGNDKTSVHFPNTQSESQKSQGLKPDKPDILIKQKGQEVLFGEVTGLVQEHMEQKNQWDTFRLARFAKARLDSGQNSIPLLQI
ncbi:hypothetical protein BGZ76_004055, partial [Entomortierella beljakovae]